MTHERIRKFNTKDTYPEQNLDNDLCQVVRAGNMVFLRGQVGSDFEGNIVGIGDPEAQTDQAMKNVKQLLEEAGSCLEHVCKITVYLTDRGYRDQVYRTMGKWLKGVFPVSTGVVVSGLAKRRTLSGKRYARRSSSLFQYLRSQSLSFHSCRSGSRAHPECYRPQSGR